MESLEDLQTSQPVNIFFGCETPFRDEEEDGRGRRRRRHRGSRRCALCSCGAIRTINFTPIEDLKAGMEGGRALADWTGGWVYIFILRCAEANVIYLILV